MLCGATLAVANFAKLMLLDLWHPRCTGGLPDHHGCCGGGEYAGKPAADAGKRIGLDPTVMASPLISTILDAVSLIIFFNIAVAVLGI